MKQNIISLRRSASRLALCAAILSQPLCLLTSCSDDDDDFGSQPWDGRIIVQTDLGEVETTTRSTNANDNFTTTAGSNTVFKDAAISTTYTPYVDLFISENQTTGTTPTYKGNPEYLKVTKNEGSGTTGHSNFAFYTDEARSDTKAVTRYWPASGNGLYFYAFFPAGYLKNGGSTYPTIAGTNSSATKTATVSITTLPYDQGAIDASKKHDLMFGVPNARPVGTALSPTNPVSRPASASTMNSTAVNLNFTHCLSKIVVRITGDGKGIKNGNTTGNINGYDTYAVDQFTNATITLGKQSSTSNYGFMQKNYTVTTTTGAIACTPITSATTNAYFTLKSKGAVATNTVLSGSQYCQEYYCIIPPGQQLNGKNIIVTLANGGVLTYTIPQITSGTNYNAEPGKQYTYTITVGLHELKVTGTITNWTNVTGGTTTIYI